MERNGESCVQRAAAGDAAAFGLLVEEHTPWLLVRLTRRLGAQEAAEDVLQETFIAAYQQLAELRSPERFGAWLCSIADNKARMWQRRRITQLNSSGSVQSSRHHPSRRSRRSGRWCGRRSDD